MNKLIALFLLVLSTSTFANCNEKAILLAKTAYELDDSEYAATHPAAVTSISYDKATGDKAAVKVAINYRTYLVKFNQEVIETYGDNFEVTGRRLNCKFISIKDIYWK